MVRSVLLPPSSADSEDFLGCLLLSLPQTDGNPTMMLTCVTACALLHCRELSEDNKKADTDNKNRVEDAQQAD